MVEINQATGPRLSRRNLLTAGAAAFAGLAATKIKANERPEATEPIHAQPPTRKLVNMGEAERIRTVFDMLMQDEDFKHIKDDVKIMTAEHSGAFEDLLRNAMQWKGSGYNFLDRATVLGSVKANFSQEYSLNQRKGDSSSPLMMIYNTNYQRPIDELIEGILMTVGYYQELREGGLELPSAGAITNAKALERALRLVDRLEQKYGASDSLIKQIKTTAIPKLAKLNTSTTKDLVKDVNSLSLQVQLLNEVLKRKTPDLSVGGTKVA